MSRELFNEIRNEMPSSISIEDMDVIEIEDKKYHVEKIEELTTTDEGKYQFGGTIYAVGYLDEERGYGITGKPLFYVEQDFSKTGSYYSHQEIEYEKPYIVEKVQKIISVWTAV